MNDAALALSKQYNIETLLQAYVYAAVAQANDMMADMINDSGHVKQEGMPTRQKMVDLAISFVTEAVPSNLIDDDAYMGECTQQPNEHVFDCAIRAAVENAYSPGSPFGVIEYQIPGTHPALMKHVRPIDN